MKHCFTREESLLDAKDKANSHFKLRSMLRCETTFHEGCCNKMLHKAEYCSTSCNTVAAYCTVTFSTTKSILHSCHILQSLYSCSMLHARKIWMDHLTYL